VGRAVDGLEGEGERREALPCAGRGLSPRGGGGGGVVYDAVTLVRQAMVYVSGPLRGKGRQEGGTGLGRVTEGRERDGGCCRVDERRVLRWLAGRPVTRQPSDKERWMANGGLQNTPFV